jgi:hypothetical protein
MRSGNLLALSGITTRVPAVCPIRIHVFSLRLAAITQAVRLSDILSIAEAARLSAILSIVEGNILSASYSAAWSILAAFESVIRGIEPSHGPERIRPNIRATRGLCANEANLIAFLARVFRRTEIIVV